MPVKKGRRDAPLRVKSGTLVTGQMPPESDYVPFNGDLAAPDEVVESAVDEALESSLPDPGETFEEPSPPEGEAQLGTMSVAEERGYQRGLDEGYNLGLAVVRGPALDVDVNLAYTVGKVPREGPQKPQHYVCLELKLHQEDGKIVLDSAEAVTRPSSFHLAIASINSRMYMAVRGSKLIR